MSDPALISIHMPLAGHDLFSDDRAAHVGISIHMPLAGHDPDVEAIKAAVAISIHMPLAGHDPAQASSRNP